MLTALAKGIDKLLAQLFIAAVEHGALLTICDSIERGRWQFGFNVVIDMAEIEIAMAGQFKQVALAAAVQIMEVTNNKYCAARQNKTSGFLKNIPKAVAIWLRL
jgi:hypothetical protein